MEAQGITLVDCRPYNARITPRACALRKAKALELEKKGVVTGHGDEYQAEWGKFIEVEKCVKCPGHGAASPADLCRNGDGRPAKHDGFCQRCHCTAEAERRRETMAKETPAGEMVCTGKCKRKISEVPHFKGKPLFNYTQKKCYSCIQAEVKEARAGVSKRRKNEGNMPDAPPRERGDKGATGDGPAP